MDKEHYNRIYATEGVFLRIKIPHFRQKASLKQYFIKRKKTQPKLKMK